MCGLRLCSRFSTAHRISVPHLTGLYISSTPHAGQRLSRILWASEAPRIQPTVSLDLWLSVQPFTLSLSCLKIFNLKTRTVFSLTTSRLFSTGICEASICCIRMAICSGGLGANLSRIKPLTSAFSLTTSSPKLQAPYFLC